MWFARLVSQRCAWRVELARGHRECRGAAVVTGRSGETGSWQFGDWHRVGRRQVARPVAAGSAGRHCQRSRYCERDAYAPDVVPLAGKRGGDAWCALARCASHRREISRRHRSQTHRHARCDGWYGLRAGQEVHGAGVDPRAHRTRHHGDVSRHRANRDHDCGRGHRHRRCCSRLHCRRCGNVITRQRAGSLGCDRRTGVVVSSGICRRNPGVAAWVAARCVRALS